MNSSGQKRSHEERIGIFGGTFDPPHLAHWEMARRAISVASLDWVAFVPALQSPHKIISGKATPGDRSEMVRRAVEGEPKFRLVSCELHRPGPSYSIDTARYFRERYPEAELFWILGSDQWKVLDQWKDWEKLASLVNFLVFSRGELVCSRESVRHLACEFQVEISSTMIRDLIQRGGDWEELVPKTVAAYIRARNLYLDEA